MSPLYAPLAAGAEDDDLIRTLLPEEVTVSSVIARAVGTGHHMLKVEGYSRLKHTRGDNGSPLLSGEFRAGGHTSKIRCYLDGAHKEDAGFVSLYLCLADTGTSAAVHAEVEFELVDQWPLLPLWCRHRKRLQVSPFQPGKSWGLPRFIGAGALERWRLQVPEGRLLRRLVQGHRRRGAGRQGGGGAGGGHGEDGCGLPVQGRIVQQAPPREAGPDLHGGVC